jgi:hypothetical protein
MKKHEFFHSRDGWEPLSNSACYRELLRGENLRNRAIRVVLVPKFLLVAAGFMRKLHAERPKGVTGRHAPGSYANLKADRSCPELGLCDTLTPGGES